MTVGGAGRVASLDLLRGVAILGILPMNILAFALVPAAYQNPLAMGEISAGEWWSWRFTHLLFDQRFMTIFALMFGAGIALLSQRPRPDGASAAGRFYRRMAWLLVFGLVHAYGFWHGDILVTYALCAMLVFPMRRLGTGWLVAIALPLLAVPIMAWLLLSLALPLMPPDALLEMEASWFPPDEQIRASIAAMQGSWLEQMPERAVNAALMQTFVFAIWSLWRVTGLMLLGIALLRSGFFSASWPLWRYVAGTLLGFASGIAITGWGLARNEAIAYAMDDAMTIGQIFNFVGSLFGAFGWACLVLTLARLGRPAWLLPSIEAVGRTSFSNYLFQTLACTTIFNGHGLGWFGLVDRVHLWLVVIGVWLAQIVLTGLWLRAFAIGPIEWLWRSLAEWRLLPIRPAQG
ncbi:MAG: DUF418 domain-containing protein [Phycisphaerales bacterium]